MIKLTPAQIRAIDAEWKGAVDARFEEDAIRLHALYDGRGRDVVRAHLRSIGMGDKANYDPIQVGVISRVVHMRSVLYQQPAMRTLVRGEEPLEHDDPAMVAFRDLSMRMRLDQLWGCADLMRNLFRQCVVLFAESVAHGAVVSRIFEPYNVLRAPTLGMADLIDEDEAVAFCIRWHDDPAKRMYQLWQHGDDEDPDRWHCWNVDDAGRLHGVQPYGDEGVPPFAGLPAVLVTDTPLMGKAWLPTPQDRLSATLNIDAIANDVMLLVKQEGHTQTVVISDDPSSVPDETGADKTWKVPTGSDVKRLPSSPKIEEAGQTIERLLSMIAVAESLPPDALSRNRPVLTGASLMVAERDLDRVRSGHADLASAEEARAYAKYAAINNAYARELGSRIVPEDVRLMTTFATPSAYQDIAQQQQVSLREMAIGTSSKLRHTAMMNRTSLDDARMLLRSIEEERDEFPIASTVELIAEGVASTSQSSSVQADQNPAALVSGPKVPGIDNAKTPGAFNPELGTASEGASVTDLAARR